MAGVLAPFCHLEDDVGPVQHQPLTDSTPFTDSTPLTDSAPRTTNHTSSPLPSSTSNQPIMFSYLLSGLAPRRPQPAPASVTSTTAGGTSISISPPSPSPPSTNTDTATTTTTTTASPPPSTTPSSSSPPPNASTTSRSTTATTNPAAATPSTQRQIDEARNAVVASIGNMLDRELAGRAALLHANNAAIEKQERDVERAVAGLRRDNDKLARLAADHTRKVKEIGNVQNWAEMLEREFLIVEETLRLVREGSGSEEGSEGSWSGSECGSGCDCGREGGAGGDGKGDVVMREAATDEGLADVLLGSLEAGVEVAPESVPIPESPRLGAADELVSAVV
ncbi:hypothetical protein B0H67DRAFT_674230 [Lasiosphaeris hirsuta]|uniref:Biogenesis of lysosome-related organelles complex 1 subunit 1 n=1 Tax=Lasiosphaeris hirsuta TaxID=260670 RepID=A0AA39ZWH1_9PEZI|nr:hypothetical protein B0H67DRAFT_674230 [Lasiosphaeris hirsuta]